jgi:tRNA (Thr-GGU) A37 N-methylase
MHAREGDPATGFATRHFTNRPNTIAVILEKINKILESGRLIL